VNDMGFFGRILDKIRASDNKEYIDRINALTHELGSAMEGSYHNEKLIRELIEENNSLYGQVHPITLVEEFCNRQKYEEIPNPVYAQKRGFKNKKYSLFLQELHTPFSFEVTNLRKTIGSDEPTTIVRYIAKNFTWKSDKNLANSDDYYLLPSETIALSAGDCEDFAFLLSSLNRDIAIAYGSHSIAGYHAFNLFVFDDELYVLDATNEKNPILKYANSEYRINYIITFQKTYIVDGSVNFGTIAGWVNEIVS